MKTIITSSKPARAHDDTTTSRGAAGQRALPEISYTMFRCQQVFWHWFFHAAIQRAVQLASRCWASIKSPSQDGGNARRISSICASSPGLDVHSTNIPGNTSNHMHNDTNKSAPSAPAPFIVMNVTTTPASILDNLIYRFMVSGTNRHLRIAAIDLNLAFTFDETAEGELLQALGCSDLNVTTAAGLDCMLEILKRAGAINPDFDPAQPDLIRLKFNAAPLLDLLKAMPHRIGGLALSREAYEDMYGHSN
jgi:hypothetical protein